MVQNPRRERYARRGLALGNKRKVRILHRVPVRCDDCGAPIRMRITDDGYRALVKVLDDPNLGDDTVLQTYQCARRLPDGSLCNGMVYIRVRHWREI